MFTGAAAAAAAAQLNLPSQLLASVCVWLV
jgi:hypothetical protein